MELNFIETIEGKEWEVEFEVTGDFNLHLERKQNGSLVVSQRGSESGEYAASFVRGVYEGSRVIDYDFGALVYPKWIKVVSGSKVAKVFVTCPDGEVTQIGGSKYEFVDLGLPSGTKWATTNVGATKPEDFGLYFAWGEIQGYGGITDEKQFSWADYKLCGGSNSTLTKYNNNSSYGIVDNLTVLEQVDDAAYTSDKICRMPTKADFEELTANTTSTWETLNGVNGRRFTSKTNGNSIFIPAAGYCGNGSADRAGSNGFLWSSSFYKDNPSYGRCFVFTSNGAYVNGDFRCNGFTVRAVLIN